MARHHDCGQAPAVAGPRAGRTGHFSARWSTKAAAQAAQGRFFLEHRPAHAGIWLANSVAVASSNSPSVSSMITCEPLSDSSSVASSSGVSRKSSSAFKARCRMSAMKSVVYHRADRCRRARSNGWSRDRSAVGGIDQENSAVAGAVRNIAAGARLPPSTSSASKVQA